MKKIKSYKEMLEAIPVGFMPFRDFFWIRKSENVIEVIKSDCHVSWAPVDEEGAYFVESFEDE